MNTGRPLGKQSLRRVTGAKPTTRSATWMAAIVHCGVVASRTGDRLRHESPLGLNEPVWRARAAWGREAFPLRGLIGPKSYW